MATEAPRRPISLAQSIDEENLDGEITLDEAIADTDCMKLQFLEKPLIVHKKAGAVKVGEFPAKDELDDSGKKKLQFLDVIMNHKGKFDFKEIEKPFLQQRYADLPDPLGMKGSCLPDPLQHAALHYPQRP